jgi:hypothetical protein
MKESLHCLLCWAILSRGLTEQGAKFLPAFFLLLHQLLLDTMTTFGYMPPSRDGFQFAIGIDFGET